MKKIFKKLICVFMSIVFMMSVNMVYAEDIIKYSGKSVDYTSLKIKVSVNGEEIDISNNFGILQDNYALLPYEDVFINSEINAKATVKSKKITITYRDKKIVLKVGSKEATANGEKIILPVAPIKVTYKSSNITKVLVPSRVVANALGLDYNWDKEKCLVSISKPTIEIAYSGKTYNYDGARTKVMFDNKEIKSEMFGIILNDTTLVSAETIFRDGIGTKYKYNSEKGTVLLTKNNHKIKFKIGTKKAYVDGKKIKLPSASLRVYVKSLDKTYIMVPAEITAKSFGYDYEWNNSKLASIITTNETVEKTTESKTEVTTEVKTEPKTEATTEKATESKIEVTTEKATESKTEVTTETTTEIKEEIMTEITTEKATESKIEATTEKKVEATTEIVDDSLWKVVSDESLEYLSQTVELEKQDGLTETRIGSVAFDNETGLFKIFATSAITSAKITSSNNTIIVDIPNSQSISNKMDISNSNVKQVEIVPNYGGVNTTRVIFYMDCIDAKFEASFDTARKSISLNIKKNYMYDLRIFSDDKIDSVEIKNSSGITAEIKKDTDTLKIVLPYSTSKIDDESAIIIGNYIRNISYKKNDNNIEINLNLKEGFSFETEYKSSSKIIKIILK